MPCVINSFRKYFHVSFSENPASYFDFIPSRLGTNRLQWTIQNKAKPQAAKRRASPAWVTCESDVSNAIDENIIHDQGYVEAFLNRGATIPFRTIGLLFIFEFRILWWPLSERFRGRRSLKHEKSRDLCVVMRWIGWNGLRNRWPISEENQATWLISLCNYTGVLPC